MTMSARILGRVRQLIAPLLAEGDESQVVAFNPRNELLVALAAPGLSEVTRVGETWQVRSAAGIAALTAAPTVTAGLSIYNGEVAGGSCLVIESFGSDEEVVDATQTDDTAIFAMMNAIPLASAVPTDGGQIIRSTIGRQPLGAKVRTVAGATVTNDGWFPHATAGQMAPAAAGANFKVNEVVNASGLYIVPPGGQFNVVALKAAAAAAAQQFYFIRFHRVKIPVNMG